MNRRAFIIGGVAALAAPLAAEAQPPMKPVPGRIAFLCSDSCTTLPSAQFPGDQAFVRGLERTGYVLGRNIQIDSSAVGIGIDRLTERAKRLVDRKVTVIVVVTTLAGLAARHATTSIPIVMMGAEDPIQEGLVNSLARPGGNVTGLAIPSGQLVAKQIELLREIQPNIRRLAVLWDPKAHQTGRLTRIEAALEHLGVRVHRVEFSSHPDTEKALMALARVDALLGLEHLANAVARRDIALFALRARLPMVASTTGFAPSGALVTYGPNLADLFDGASHYVGRILNGAKPSELPIEEPRRFALTLNVGTAKALGVIIPPSLLARADQVVE
jgi:putative tryptophan/tyrosine transport system substrate-binding protein